MFYLKKYIYFLALELASPGNRHCASCIGTLSFPIGAKWNHRRAAAMAGSAQNGDVAITGIRVLLCSVLSSFRLIMSRFSFSCRSKGCKGWDSADEMGNACL